MKYRIQKYKLPNGYVAVEIGNPTIIKKWILRIKLQEYYEIIEKIEKENDF